MISFSYPPTSMTSLYEGDSRQQFRQYLKDSELMLHGAGMISDIVSQATDKQVGAIREASQEQVGAIREASQEQVDAIREASQEQVQAIRESGEMIVSAVQEIGVQISESVRDSANRICKGLTNIEDQLQNLNRRTDLQIEQHKMTNYLLENIVELLKIPDSEKERQHAITLGLKFFVNAAKSPELYSDALEWLLKAESLQKQDYFVLHRIGCIYLYVDLLMDLEKARDYFSRAARYASVDSDPDAVRLANILTSPSLQSYSVLPDNPEKILLLASDSYEKAAFASYVMGDMDGAIDYQRKAVRLNGTDQNKYNLSKYLSHQGSVEDAIENLDEVIENSPLYAAAVFQEADMVCREEIVNYIDRKNTDVDEKLQDAITATKDPRMIRTISEVLESGSYMSKRRILRRINKYQKTDD